MTSTEDDLREMAMGGMNTYTEEVPEPGTGVEIHLAACQGTKGVAWSAGLWVPDGTDRMSLVTHDGGMVRWGVKGGGYDFSIALWRSIEMAGELAARRPCAARDRAEGPLTVVTRDSDGYVDRMSSVIRHDVSGEDPVDEVDQFLADMLATGRPWSWRAVKRPDNYAAQAARRLSIGKTDQYPQTWRAVRREIWTPPLPNGYWYAQAAVKEIMTRVDAAVKAARCRMYSAQSLTTMAEACWIHRRQRQGLNKPTRYMTPDGTREYGFRRDELGDFVAFLAGEWCRSTAEFFRQRGDAVRDAFVAAVAAAIGDWR